MSLKKTNWRDSEDNHQKELAKIKKPEPFLSMNDVLLLVRGLRDTWKEADEHVWNDLEGLWNDIMSLPMYEEQSEPSKVVINWVPYRVPEKDDTFIGPYWSIKNPFRVTCDQGIPMCGE